MHNYAVMAKGSAEVDVLRRDIEFSRVARNIHTTFGMVFYLLLVRMYSIQW